MIKILITGSTGMVGRNIINYLTTKEFFLLTPKSSELNLLDKRKIDYYLDKNKPDLIIHSAGVVGGIQANILNPVKFLYDNSQMGLNIIKSAFEHKILKFINLASSCMYPKDLTDLLKEDYILTGKLEPTNEGYALAKILTTKLCEYIFKENNNYKYKTIIPCNLYGKYDKFDSIKAHLIPAVINKIHKAKVNNMDIVEIWGTGEVKREFMYTEDLADFILYAIKNFDRLPQNLNVGTGKDYTINKYYEIVSSVIGYKGGFKHDLTKPVGMAQKTVDISKLNKFGWKSKISLEEGIEKTYQYFLKEINNG